MEVSGRQRFVWITAALLLLILVRVGLIWRSNREAEKPVAAPAAAPVNPDAYVALPKLHAYDLQSARLGLEGKTIWVAAGDQIDFYPAQGASVDWKHAKGKLSPLDALHVTKVVKTAAPVELIKQGNVTFHKEGTPKIAAIFTHAGDTHPYAIEVGTEDHGSYSFNVDDLFYLEDPHQLYKHWPPEVWKAIDEHRAEKGMSELQAALALGPGASENSNAYGNRTMEYQHGGKKTTVTFANDRATQVTQE